MDSIGQYLKEKREALNYSLDYVSNETKMKKYLLEQIENDDFDSISDVGFIKIMVITYCRAVKGNEELVQKKLIKIFDKPIEPPIKINTAKNVKPVVISTNFIYFVLLGFFVIFLAFSLFNLYKKGTFSFNAIKNQISSAERKVRSVNTDNSAQPDSLWLMQRKLFNEKNNIDPQYSKPEVKTVIIDTASKKNDKKSQDVRNFNKSRNYIQDKTDYVGLLIFNNQISPLNPDF